MENLLTPTGMQPGPAEMVGRMCGRHPIDRLDPDDEVDDPGKVFGAQGSNHPVPVRRPPSLVGWAFTHGFPFNDVQPRAASQAATRWAFWSAARGMPSLTEMVNGA